MRRKNRRAQTMLEFATIFVIVIGAFIAMQAYIQRGIQGKFKETIDDMAKQYDPTAMVNATHTMSYNALTSMTVHNVTNGYVTRRQDITNTQDSSSETITIQD